LNTVQEQQTLTYANKFCCGHFASFNHMITSKASRRLTESLNAMKVTFALWDCTTWIYNSVGHFMHINWHTTPFTWFASNIFTVKYKDFHHSLKTSPSQSGISGGTLILRLWVEKQ